jgi:U4/U6 small nuclear ribonucleoprotein PRP31
MYCDYDEAQGGGRGEGMEVLDEEEEEEQLAKLKYTDVSKLATLREKGNVRTLLERIEDSLTSVRLVGEEIVGSLEEDPEYKLIVESNQVLMEIGLETFKIHKFILDLYALRFPELEQMVLNPLDFVRVVKKIGGEKNIASVDLTGLLPASTLMVVIVTASNTSGKPLSSEDLEKVLRACEEILFLDDLKQKLLSYVESRMSFIAPNLSAIVGTSIAAQLIGVAGGLAALSRLPSNILQLLGAKKKTLSGFSSASAIRHTGFIYDAELIKQTPPSLQTKACRLLAGKCTLAARVDSFHESPRGEAGQQFREVVEKKLERWQEPPPGKLAKPLPAPDDKPKKHRGGRRQRRMKEKFATTELRKYANRIVFGAAEDTFGESEKGIGMLSRSGKVKLTVQEKGSLIKGLNKRNRQRLLGNNNPSSSTPLASSSSAQGTTSFGTSGLSSSLAFTPIQGLALAAPTPNTASSSSSSFSSNPSSGSNEKRYFGNATFTKIAKPQQHNPS